MLHDRERAQRRHHKAHHQNHHVHPLRKPDDEPAERGPALLDVHVERRPPMGMEVGHEGEPRQKHLPRVGEEGGGVLHGPAEGAAHAGASDSAGHHGRGALERRYDRRADGEDHRERSTKYRVAAHVGGAVAPPDHPGDPNESGRVQGRTGGLHRGQQGERGPEPDRQRHTQPAPQAPHQQEDQQRGRRVHARVVVHGAEHEREHRLKGHQQARRQRPGIACAARALAASGTRTPQPRSQQRGHEPHRRELGERVLRVRHGVGGDGEQVVPRQV